jgi:GDP-4-dehydro-6-deoxy-D-mannose reductase
MRLKPRRIWITGAAGFTGRYFARFLREQPLDLELIGIDRVSEEPDDFDKWYALDLTHTDPLRQLAQTHPPTRVFHLAGAIPPADDVELWQSNVAATQILLQTIARQCRGQIRVVTIGSAAEYAPARHNLRESDPCGSESAYGRTKWAQTIIALACGREFGLDVMVARTFNLIGPGLSPHLVPGSLCSQFAGAGPIRVGETRSIRDFIDIRDAVGAYWVIAEKGHAGNIYNVGTGRGTSIKKLLALFGRVAGSRTVEAVNAPAPSADYHRVVADISKLRRLGWKPCLSLEQSVRDMLKQSRTV